MNTRPQVTSVPYSPENKGQIFSQQVMPPSEVYWPMITSRKNTGKPPPNRKIKYGIRNAPAEREEWGEGQVVAITGATSKPSWPMRSKRMSEGQEGWRPKSWTHWKILQALPICLADITLPVGLLNLPQMHQVIFKPLSLCLCCSNYLPAFPTSIHLKYGFLIEAFTCPSPGPPRAGRELVRKGAVMRSTRGASPAKGGSQGEE